MNKKGQLDFPIILIVIIIFGLLLIAPFILKIFNSIQGPVSAQLGNVSGGTIAAANFNTVMNTAVTFWDKVMIAAFIVSVLMMLISSFMIDTSPFWVILYILIGLFVVLFSPNIIDSLSAIYESPTFATEVTQLSFMDGLRTHFGEVLVGLFVITGIIIYGKIAFFPSRSGR